MGSDQEVFEISWDGTGRIGWLLSPPLEVGGVEHEGVLVSENLVVEIGGVAACDGGKGMMEMDKKE